MYELFTLGSSDGPHKTETSAIVAGTGSEITLPPKRGRKRKNTSDIATKIKPLKSNETIVTTSTVLTENEENTLATADGVTVSISDGTKVAAVTGNAEGERGKQPPFELDHESREEMMLSSRRQKKKRKRKKKKTKAKDMEVEGHRITGLENMDTFNPGSEDEDNATSNRQDDIILRKLFKKSGIRES